MDLPPTTECLQHQDPVLLPDGFDGGGLQPGEITLLLRWPIARVYDWKQFGEVVMGEGCEFIGRAGLQEPRLAQLAEEFGNREPVLGLHARQPPMVSAA